MKTIGDRTTFIKDKNKLSIVISSKIEKWQEMLLVSWFLMWSVVGVFFIYYLTQTQTDDEFVYLLIVSMFWLFFEVRVFKALIWRLKGKELIKIDNQKFFFKRSYLNYGKLKEYFIDNISSIEKVEVNENSPFQNFNNSFWTMGTPKLQLKHLGKYLRFGYQLPDEDVKLIIRLINSTLEEKRAEIKRMEKKKNKDLSVAND